MKFNEELRDAVTRGEIRPEAVFRLDAHTIGAFEEHDWKELERRLQCGRYMRLNSAVMIEAHDVFFTLPAPKESVSPLIYPGFQNIMATCHAEQEAKRAARRRP